MHHQRFASVLANKGRSPLVWGPPLALAGVVGAVLGGCPGPDPQISDGAGGGHDTTGVGTGPADAGAQGGAGGAGGAGGEGGGNTSTGDGGADAGCGPDRELCGDRCTNTTKGDPKNCGQCGKVCPTHNVNQAQCLNSICLLECVDGFVNVDPTSNQNCETPVRRVFVTSMPTNVKFGTVMGGVHAANTFCNQLDPIPGATWAAWIATANSLPKTTVVGAFDGAYVLMDGRTVVATATELLSGTLRHAIDLTETMSTLTAGAGVGVWTGADQAGGATSNDCMAWTSVEGNATAGIWTATNSSWTNGGNQAPCSSMQHVYCFQK